MSRIEIDEFILHLATTIREAVRPLLGTRVSKTIVGLSKSGDATYELDRVAEQIVSETIQASGLPLSVYSEDEGLVSYHDEPEFVLVIDPVDGTRPAVAGLETCCVSVAAAPYGPRPTLGDIQQCCLISIKEGDVFRATRGQGITMTVGGQSLPPALSSKPDLDEIFWSFELAGRPAKPIMEWLGPLIDRTSIAGSAFVFASSTYAMTRIVTGRFDAFVDVGARLLGEFPDLEEAFRTAGRGQIIGLFSYDLAAIAPLLQEAGAVITDAWGRSLDGVSLFDVSSDNIQSCLAAANPELHRALLDYLNENIEKMHREKEARL